MPVGLSAKNDRRREALLAHAQWERLVIGAVIFDLVRDVLLKSAVLAFLVGQVLILAFAKLLP